MQNSPKTLAVLMMIALCTISTFISLGTPKKGAVEKDYKKDITDALSKLMDIHQSSGDGFRAMGYRRAITNIKAYKGPITKVS